MNIKSFFGDVLSANTAEDFKEAMKKELQHVTHMADNAEEIYESSVDWQEGLTDEEFSSMALFALFVTEHNYHIKRNLLEAVEAVEENIQLLERLENNMVFLEDDVGL